MDTIQDIVEKLKHAKPELERKYPITGIGVFGSYARGHANKESDIDIAVDIDGTMGLNFIAMADEIEAILGIKTDVIPMRSIKPEYLPSVEKDIIYV
jgi:predicted nucleotidyltransferase